MEFVVLVGIAFFTFLAMLIIIFYHTGELRDRKESESVVDISLMVQSELNSAAVVKDGYTRDFKLPQTIYGKDYIITTENNRVYFKTANYEAGVIVPEFQGDLQKGTNVINKTGGVIYLTH
ncbi:MAG: hypothetical protein ABIH63_00690 [archaeon]